jgi:hypothetical protein
MDLSKFLAVNLLVIITLAIAVSGVSLVVGQADDATTKLETANNAVQQAFNNVLSAEKAGANVTSLLNQLNSAANYLAEAENANRAGDNSAVTSNANLALLITQQVNTQVQSAKESATIATQNSFWLTIGFTIVGAILLILSLFWGWHFFKQFYIRKLMESKPEVTNN